MNWYWARLVSWYSSIIRCASTLCRRSARMCPSDDFCVSSRYDSTAAVANTPGSSSANPNPPAVDAP